MNDVPLKNFRLMLSLSGEMPAEIPTVNGGACASCPFRLPPSVAFFDENQRARIVNRIETLGGFPCHSLEGHTKAFETDGVTLHPCRGWLQAGGTVEAFNRRYPRRGIDPLYCEPLVNLYGPLTS